MPKSSAVEEPIERAILVYVNEDEADDQLVEEELEGLCEAARVEPVAGIRQRLDRPHKGTFIGSGKVEEIAAEVKAQEVELVIMDGALSPVQQRNLEKAFGAKVIDRTGLILEIFGRRARTREGTLQVELAHLTYQKSRLVRSWTHLERQRGGFGFLGGPGETQIETDRRLIQERITRIERELEKVKKTRGLHRKSRRAVPYPVVALVGYTNAGKSSLLNALTSGSDVFVADQPFATLDPTLRKVRLGDGAQAVLADTVGFISDLPKELVNAFRATLEEVTSATLLLHVIDASNPFWERQRDSVDAILAELGAEAKPTIVAWNKTDVAEVMHSHEGVAVSAKTGRGLAQLKALLAARLHTL